MKNIREILEKFNAGIKKVEILLKEGNSKTARNMLTSVQKQLAKELK